MEGEAEQEEEDEDKEEKEEDNEKLESGALRAGASRGGQAYLMLKGLTILLRSFY